jgi:hypothetical protein
MIICLFLFKVSIAMFATGSSVYSFISACIGLLMGRVF